MANPFFSGRIPSGLADKIDAYLLNTGETHSKLLMRLLRTEIGDNNNNNISDNQIDNTLNQVFIRLERLERSITKLIIKFGRQVITSPIVFTIHNRLVKIG